MCCKNFWKRIIPFVIALAIGFFAVNFSYNKGNADIEISACNMNKFSREKRESVTSVIDVNSDRLMLAGDYHVKVISEIPAKYTEVARQNRTQGKVILRVDFLANGKIGKISVVESLPHGLTEQAISATKQIKFQPAGHCWGFNNETATVTYTFSLN